MVKIPPVIWKTWVCCLDWEIPWRRALIPSPVFWPREFHGQMSLANCSPWGLKESDTTKRLTLFTFQLNLFNRLFILFTHDRRSFNGMPKRKSKVRKLNTSTKETR